MNIEVQRSLWDSMDRWIRKAVMVADLHLGEW